MESALASSLSYYYLQKFYFITLSLLHVKKTNDYYQNHKEKHQKEARKRYQSLS